MSDIFWAIGPAGYGSYSVDWTPTGPTFTPSSQTPTQTLAPGFVDIHLHGGFGIDFMEADSHRTSEWLDLLVDKGYEAALPTTITATPEAILSAIRSLPDHPLVKGFHLEGPFISPDFPGAQPQSAIVKPPSGPSEWDPILDHPKLRLITMAPELPGGTNLVERMVARNVIVSMGHTNATYEESGVAFRKGVRHMTHTFNAMSGLHHREAGAVGFAMLESGLTTELIYDRIHVSRPAAKILIKNKPSDKLIAVSDATMAAGMEAGTHITMWGLPCFVGENQVRLASNGSLAGSAITLLEAFQNLATDFGIETAIGACCVNPRRALGMNDQPRVYLQFDPEFRLLKRLAPNGHELASHQI